MPFSDPLKKKSPPPETTNEEAGYLKRLAEKQIPITLKLINGETLRGFIEYYDLNMLRLTRQGKPNLFIFKHQIAYLTEEA